MKPLMDRKNAKIRTNIQASPTTKLRNRNKIDRIPSTIEVTADPYLSLCCVELVSVAIKNLLLFLQKYYYINHTSILET
jgi:hypothetical protein